MEFYVTDRAGIESGVLVRSTYVVISIHDPDREKPKVKQQAGLRAVLQLEFHDAAPSDRETLDPGVVVMSADQARQIWRFIDQHKDEVGAVVVQCEAGMSRSPAVAAALCASLGGDEAQFFRTLQPNEHVYRLVRTAAELKRVDVPRP
jgi:predicted protein tyrosine phosphatase